MQQDSNHASRYHESNVPELEVTDLDALINAGGCVTVDSDGDMTNLDFTITPAL